MEFFIRFNIKDLIIIWVAQMFEGDTKRRRFSHFKSVVKREPVEENVGEELAEAEDAVDHPVGQPLGVIFFTRTFDGFDPADIKETPLRQRGRFREAVGRKQATDSRVISRVDETDEITEQRGSVAINQVEPGQRHAP